MGAGIQTGRKLIDDGVIGEVIGCAGYMLCHGHESWHPDPEFYYKYGGGPMFDMGPYYITALLNLVGCGVEAVSAMTRTTFPERLITSEPHNGEIIKVDVPTLYAGNMRFTNGAIGTLYTTFDVYPPAKNNLEIYGTKGSLIVPDPNCFGGSVKLIMPGKDIEEIPLCFAYEQNSRALGLADMAKAMQTGRDFRSTYKQTYHVLEIMEGFAESGRIRKEVEILSHFEKTPAMVQDPEVGILD